VKAVVVSQLCYKEWLGAEWLQAIPYSKADMCMEIIRQERILSKCIKLL